MLIANIIIRFSILGFVYRLFKRIEEVLGVRFLSALCRFPTGSSIRVFNADIVVRVCSFGQIELRLRHILSMNFTISEDQFLHLHLNLCAMEGRGSCVCVNHLKTIFH